MHIQCSQLKCSCITPKCSTGWIVPILVLSENAYVHVSDSAFGATADNSHAVHIAESVQRINDFVVYTLADYFCTPWWDRPCRRNTTHYDDVGQGNRCLPCGLAHGPHRAEAGTIAGVSIYRRRISTLRTRNQHVGVIAMALRRCVADGHGTRRKRTGAFHCS